MMAAKYKKINPAMWTDERFNSLSSSDPSAQFLWIWLLTGPLNTLIPGVIPAGMGALEDRLKWSRSDIAKYMDEISKKGMIKYDFDAPVIWIPKAICHNMPESPNVVKSWGYMWGDVPHCDIKCEMWEWLYMNMKAMDSRSKTRKKAFENAYLEHVKKPEEITEGNVFALPREAL